MHILGLLVAALGAIALIVWRINMASHAAKDVVDAADVGVVDPDGVVGNQCTAGCCRSSLLVAAAVQLAVYRQCVASVPNIVRASRFARQLVGARSLGQVSG